MHRITFVLSMFCSVLCSVACAQSVQDPPEWKALHLLIGRWEGTGEGESGRSAVTRSYEAVLGSKFIMGKNRSEYQAQEKNPNGEIHENWDVLSWDRRRQKSVFRQFHVEGFVNQYVLDSVSSDLKFFRFVTEAIENIPAGWRARETYEFRTENEFVETFELAEPGKDFTLYTRNHFRRK